MSIKIKRKPPEVTTVLAEWIGIGHFIVVSAIALLGQFTELFRPVRLKGDYPGLFFVYDYIVYPVYWFFEGSVKRYLKQPDITVVYAIAIFFLASALYSLIALLFFKFLKKLFKG